MFVKATLFSIFYVETQLSERGEKYQKGCDNQDFQDYFKVHQSIDLHTIQRCVPFNLLLVNLDLDVLILPCRFYKFYMIYNIP